jgi:hypothetical protein
MKTNLVVLESMWTGKPGVPAPRWFRINERNHSGRRLHNLLKVDPAEGNVWVTNACQIQQATANDHGTPDPVALAENIATFPSEIDWLIVGGKVAGDTFYGALTSPAVQSKLAGARVLHMPHPAARMWTHAMQAAVCNFLAMPAEACSTAAEIESLGVQFRRAPQDLGFPVWIVKPGAALTTTEES